MPVFELRRLRLLHELALRGTLAAVAEALAYSPSTISQQLTQLEKEAGVVLLAPDGRRVRLTEHGRILAAHAARALDLDERARGELESLHPGLAPVRVAVMQTAALAIVPCGAGAPRRARSAPACRTRRDAARARALRADRSRGRSRHRRAVPRTHARAHRGPRPRDARNRPDPPGRGIRRPARSLDDLRDRPWVMEPAATAARLWAVQQCRAAGFEPDVRYELADLSAHARLVAAGQAVAVLPDLLWEGAAAPVTLLDLPGRPHARDLQRPAHGVAGSSRHPRGAARAARRIPGTGGCRNPRPLGGRGFRRPNRSRLRCGRRGSAAPAAG